MRSIAEHQRRVVELRADGSRFEIAVEHAAWASAAGLTPTEVILSVAQALPVDPDWGDVIYALVYAQCALERGWRHKPGADRLRDLRPRRVA